MKTAELTALGISEEVATKILAMNGKDIENAKAGKDTEIAKITAERDDLKTRLATAETTLTSFEGIDPKQIKDEVQTWKKKAEDAEKNFNAQITARDQKDWINKKLDEYEVKSPYARKSLTDELMSAEGGLTWKDNKFFGFDDFMKAAKEKDSSLYLTAEEKAAKEQAANAQQAAPKFTGPTGKQEDGSAGNQKKAPQIF
ncbi:MAG: phage scaffolding protein [Clostridia bacterium]|nr:phage scaffolding protein [Clostridia bacterium]